MTDDELKRLIEGSAAETRRHVDGVVGEFREEVRGTTAELRQENVETRQELRTTTTELRREHAETRRHFDVVVEEFKSQVQLIAENVLSTGERLDRRIDGLESRMNDEFGEVKAMMRFSYADLDRRLRSLEERVERLESRPTN